ncbi:xanthine phosphoribosyltransferase [Brassicibacter mesophilus]|uniref:xanthine phosphoribosyltransferase n=1 Tax=Brassicibacter mesophilus TaxID=745119 RepID=UPI003D246A4A
MELLKNKIMTEGRIEHPDILKVDSFLNHQLDISFLNDLGKEFKKRFEDKRITKILTIEASGIAIASIAAQYFDVSVVFAKKVESKNLDKETYESDVYSFTKAKTYKIKVSKRYITSDDHILILDDFLANGRAVLGLIDIVNQADAKLEGVGIVIEKGFQEGGEILRNQGINLESLVIIDSFDDGKIVFK